MAPKGLPHLGQASKKSAQLSVHLVSFFPTAAYHYRRANIVCLCCRLYFPATSRSYPKPHDYFLPLPGSTSKQFGSVPPIL